MSKIVLRLLVAVVAVGTVGAVLLAGLLLSGPVSLPWLTPYVVRALENGPAGENVAIDDVRLRLGQDHLLELSAIGVRTTDAAGNVVLELSDLEVSLSTSALLFHGTLAPEQLSATVPSLELTRREDGSFGIGERAPSAAGSEAKFDLIELIDGFLASRDAAAPLAYLERILVTSRELSLVDRKIDRVVRARDAALTIDLGAGEARADLGFILEQPERAASVRISADHRIDDQRIGFDVGFEGLAPATLSGYVAAPLDGLDFELDGAVGGAITAGGELAPISFRVATEGGTVDLPDLMATTLEINGLRLRGTLDDDLQAISIEAFSLASLGATLSGRGGAAWREGGPTLHADIVAHNVAARELRRLWPPRIGRDARTWVVENITDGVVPEAHATLRFGPGDLDQDPVPEDTVSGTFGLQDLTLRYYETMPPLTGVDGMATFTARRMDFAVTDGHVGDLQLGDDGSVVITGMGIPGRYTTQLEITAEISGPVDQALNLIDYPPLGFAADIGIVPETSSGESVTALRIGMPLNRELEVSDVRVEASSTIADAAIRGEPVDLERGRLTLVVDNEGADLAGEAVVAGVPLNLEIRENFGDERPFDRRYRVLGTPEVAALAALGFDVPFDVEGQLGLDATIVEARSVREIELALDLAPAGIGVAALPWDKPPGEPGTLRVTAVLPADGPLQVTAFALDSAELSAAGSLDAEIEPPRLLRAQLDRVRLRESEASITLEAGEPEGYEAKVRAETLDLSPWVENGDADDGSDPPSLRLELRAERLIVEDASLTDVDANLISGPDGWRSALLTGGLASGGQLEVSLSPAEDRRQLHVTSTDAGDLLRSLDQTSRIVGGELQLDATILEQRPTLRADGTLRANDFRILDAPTLARLLTVASLTGIGDLLAGEGLHVDELEVPFTLEGDLLTLGKGRMFGSQLGLTFEGVVDRGADMLDVRGTIVPAYGVNWAIGQIPVIGSLLKGSEGEGAFAASYSMSGPIDVPEVAVDPLSALTPGFFKELFSGLRAGNLEPPGEQPSGDD